MVTEKEPLPDVLPAAILNDILREITEKRSADQPYEYPVLTRMVGSLKYTIKAKDYGLDNVMSQASGSCKMCSYGKGYYVSHVEKKKVPNPDGLMIFKPETEVPDGLLEEQRKIFLEVAKKRHEESPYWRVLNVCYCAAKNTLRKNKNVVSNSNYNIFVQLDYEVEETGGSA